MDDEIRYFSPLPSKRGESKSVSISLVPVELGLQSRFGFCVNGAAVRSYHYVNE